MRNNTLLYVGVAALLFCYIAENFEGMKTPAQDLVTGVLLYPHSLVAGAIPLNEITNPMLKDLATKFCQSEEIAWLMSLAIVYVVWRYIVKR